VSPISFTELFQKYIDQTCTPAEVDQLFDMLENGAGGAEEQALLKTHFEADLEPTGYTDDDLRQRLERRFRLIEQHITSQAPPAKRISLTRRWVAAAAVIIMLLGSGIWYWLGMEHKPAVAVTPPPQNEVVPGTNKAVLTLADGKTISLDSSVHGTLGKQGQSTVNQQGGKLVYEVTPASTGAPVELMYNTLATPRGGQYQLTLPEGTQVWLNAASSIRYPAVFNDSARVVYITGEVYFEVKQQFGKNGKKIPFNVIVPPLQGGPGGAEVKVLGTHFNINAYEDEPYITTTLLEGKVSINRPGIASPAFLSPGQQAQLNPLGNQVRVINDANIAQTMGWKNGLFVFDGVELKTVMRQLARWYDVEISFEPGAPVSELFKGPMQRSLQISQVLKGMTAMGIHVKKEGKKIIVMP
jgi:transmembrane sensor